jgi:hypothetical protein
VADEETEKLGLEYIWKSLSENNLNGIRKVNQETCNDVQVQNSFTDISPENSLLYYCELEQ